MSKKEKYLQVFNYLLEFAKIRSKPVRDILVSKSKYPEILWLANLPNHKNSISVLQDSFDKESEFWVSVKKPKKPVKPKFPEPSGLLGQWIKPESLIDEENGPVLLASIERNGDELIIEEYPEIEERFRKYVNGTWLEDILGYKELLEKYNELFKEYEDLQKTYEFFFKIHNKSQQFGEEFELVMGVGLLNFKENDKSAKVFRHILTQKVETYFQHSGQGSEIILGPSIEGEISLETESIIDLFDQFDTESIISAEKNFLTTIEEKEILQLFPKEKIEEPLQRFIDEIRQDSEFENKNDKPTEVSNVPKLSFSPALILRKRNTQSFTTLYKSIIKDIVEADDDVSISSFDDVVGMASRSDNENVQQSQAQTLTDQTVYFPKESNAEQLSIVEKARYNQKVLVQGPPGTGKSHTIANLICHLLANGDKVLVTAHTKRALQVLKSKLPEEFQSLAINLLSGDSSSINDLESSTRTIMEEISGNNFSTYQADISELSEDLHKTKKKLSEKRNDLVKVKEKEVRETTINNFYKGTLLEIAERLEAESEKYNWYKDDFSDINDAQSVSDVKELVFKSQNYKVKDLSVYGYELPKEEDLIRIKEIETLNEHKKALQKLSADASNKVSISSSDYSALILSLKKALKLLDDIDSLSLKNDIKAKIIQSSKSNDLEKWRRKNVETDKIIKRLQTLNLKELDKNIEILYPKEKSIKQLKHGALVLKNHIEEGNSLTGVLFRLKKALLPKDVREQLYIIDAVTVNGSACDTLDEFNLVIQDLEIKSDFADLNDIWALSHTSVKYFDLLSEYSELKNKTFDLLILLQSVSEQHLAIKELSDVKTSNFDKADVSLFLSSAEYKFHNEKRQWIEREVSQSLTKLSINGIHPISQELSNALQDSSEAKYGAALLDLKEIKSDFTNFSEYQQLKEKVRQVFPILIEDFEDEFFTGFDIAELSRAIFYKHAQKEVVHLLSEAYQKSLKNEINNLEKNEKQVLSDLASKKAWVEVLGRLKDNYNLRRHLQAWSLAVKKIGKTGRGKRALKFRKEAQAQMEKCITAVPCWIMPLYKVAETITPKQGMYDVAIIDEASQLGPDALFLMYIAKKIIIVGDDKQTSPEYVGLDADTMTPHINRHLKDIPFANFYGTDFSFFDHASMLSKDGMVVLREHFRCMPEIIEFSNKHFYQPEGIGLYPLKQYSEKRLEPIETVFCKDGYSEGTGSRITNLPEAEKITETIASLLKDPSYQGKTFGVIALQGNQQAALIENLLLKRIGEKKFFEREIVCGKSASFQGDERDVIFLSLVTANNHRRSALVKPEDERRFNVAASRAKEQLWLFHSIEQQDLSNSDDLRYKLLDHCLHFKDNRYKQTSNKVITVPRVKARGTQPPPFDSWFEVDVYNDIISKGYLVYPQYEVARGQYRIDIVAFLPNGTKIAVECDGDAFHGAEHFQNDILRQNILERCGWQFFRVSGGAYYIDRKKALEPLWEILGNNEEDIVEAEEVSLTADEPAESVHSKKVETEGVKDFTLQDVEEKADFRNELFSDDTNDLDIETSPLDGVKSQQSEYLQKCSHFLIFTDQFNVYRFEEYGSNEHWHHYLSAVQFEEGEKPIYITGTNNYSGYLLTAYENGKIAKVYLKSFKTRNNRSRLKNAYNDQSKLVFIEHILEEIDLVAVSNIDKVVLFNTSQINAKASKTSSGVQVMKSRNESTLFTVRQLHDVDLDEPEYYRKNIPATGSFLKDFDSY